MWSAIYLKTYLHINKSCFETGDFWPPPLTMHSFKTYLALLRFNFRRILTSVVSTSDELALSNLFDVRDKLARPIEATKSRFNLLSIFVYKIIGPWVILMSCFYFNHTIPFRRWMISSLLFLEVSKWVKKARLRFLTTVLSEWNLQWAK